MKTHERRVHGFKNHADALRILNNRELLEQWRKDHGYTNVPDQCRFCLAIVHKAHFRRHVQRCQLSATHSSQLSDDAVEPLDLSLHQPTIDLTDTESNQMSGLTAPPALFNESTSVHLNDDAAMDDVIDETEFDNCERKCLQLDDENTHLKEENARLKEENLQLLRD